MVLTTQGTPTTLKNAWVNIKPAYACGYTAERLPVELAWSQECAAREEALAAELQIKGWSRKKKEAMMQGDWGKVSRLAKKDFTKKKQG